MFSSVMSIHGACDGCCLPTIKIRDRGEKCSWPGNVQVSESYHLLPLLSRSEQLNCISRKDSSDANEDPCSSKGTSGSFLPLQYLMFKCSRAK